jgi:8-oxo-dGTP diphosphatase
LVFGGFAAKNQSFLPGARLHRPYETVIMRFDRQDGGSGTFVPVWGEGFVFRKRMIASIYGLREAALTLTYNLIVTLRQVDRSLRRPTEMGVRALVLRNESVVLVRHRGGKQPWSLPGGGIAPREPLDRAALREVGEEAGCNVEITALLGLYHHFGQSMNNYIAVFICTALDDPQPPRADLEIVNAGLFPFHDLPSNTEAGSRRRIADYTAGSRGIYRAW